MSYLNGNKRHDLTSAVKEAERFIEKANEAINDLDKMDKLAYTSISSKHVASAKRASMDLTRSLVFVRK